VSYCYSQVEDASASETLQPGTKSFPFIRTSLSGAILFAFAASAAAAELTVAVENVDSASGNVRIGLFASAKAFPGKPDRGETVAAAPGTVTVVFRELQAGNYAVSAFHDLNDNNKLDTGFLGRPTEPVGFSRDAHGRMGPPAFDDAAFAVDGAAVKIAVRLRP